MKTSNYSTILFDLDGTLTDPKIGVTKAIQYALKRFDIEVVNPDELQKFIGPALIDSFQKYYSLSPKDASKAVDYYREYYSEKGVYENEVYAGIPALLKELKSLGKTLAVATAKPTFYANIVLEHFDLAHFFTEIVGSNLDNTRNKKVEIISHVLQQLKVKADFNVLMIGDREYDILGAKACGIDSIGVMYGYGSLEELKQAEPKCIVGTVEELTGILLQ
ncbi:MAG: HAD family hydrolase [Chitinophagales bacterium]